MKRVCLFLIAFILILAPTSVREHRTGKVTLRFSDWHLTESLWAKSLNEAIARFEAENTDIKILVEPVPYEEKEYRYSVESEAGTAPDIFHVHCNSLQYYFSKGYARELNRFVSREGGGKYLADWFEVPVGMCRYNGRLMAMPGDFMSMVLFYNTKLFKKSGLDPQKPPGTWPEFLSACRALTLDQDADGRTDQWGFTTVGTLDPGFELRLSPFIWGFGGDYLTEDCKHSALNKPETIKGFKYFVDLCKTYKVVPPGVLRNTPQKSRIQFAHEKAAMEFGSGWTIPIVNNINKSLNAEEILQAAPVPGAGRSVTSAWLSAWVMSSGTKHPQEAWKLIRFLTSREMELKWFRDNRVLSSRKDVSTSQEVLNDRFAAMISSQLSNARFVPQIKEWPEIIEAVTYAVQEAINEIKTPEEAILDAHYKVEEILR